jgi:hypothetical protein
MIMLADMEQLMQLKNILQIFSSSTGLKVNYHKTTLVPINIDTNHATTLANAFECKVETLPFAYLGLPLGTTRPSLADLMPIVSRLDKRLSCISSLMSYTGRLTLLNSVINSLPMYAMCSLKIPITIFIHFEKSGRQFLWADKEDKIHGKCLASWEMICRPKGQGGLGVLDLRIQNKALLIKNLHKFYNQKDIPWVKLLWQAYYNNGQLPHLGNTKGSFWWKDCLSLMQDYRDITSISISNGKTCSLWKDKWMDGTRQEEYPHLFSFAKNKEISFADAYSNNNGSIYNLFHLPLSTVAHEELISLQNDMHDQELNGENDIWSPFWGDYFSTKKSIIL